MIARLTGIALLAMAVAALMLGGCAMDKTSIEDRIGEFIADVNAGDYGNLYKHLHTDCADRNAAKAAAFWDPTTVFKAVNKPFSLSGMSFGTTSTGTLNSAVGPDTITFVMKEEDPDDWFILSISVPSEGLTVN